MNNLEVRYYVEYRIENKDGTRSHTHSKQVTKDQYDFYKCKVGLKIDHLDYIKQVEDVYVLNDIDVNKELCEMIDKMDEIERRVDNETFEAFKREVLDYFDVLDDYLSY